MSYEPAIVKLSMIDYKSMAHLFCHREESVYEWDDEKDDNKMRLLADSLILEGQQVPVELIDDPEFPGEPEGTKPLLRGSRRIRNIIKIIELRLYPEKFFPDMNINAVLVSGGRRLDYLVRSVCDNELREGLSPEMKLEAARKMLELGAPAARAARAVGMSATQFARITRRLNSTAMQRHIASGHITATAADTLLEAAGQVNRIGELERDFETVVAVIKAKTAEDRIKATRNKDKFDQAKKAVVSGHIKPAHVAVWVKAIRDGKPMAISFKDEDEDDRSVFACLLDTDKGTLKMPSLNLDLHKIEFAALGEVAGKLVDTANWVEQFYLMKKAQKAQGNDRVKDKNKSLLEFFRRHGDLENVAKIEAEIARFRGEADPDHGRVAPRTEAPLADAIVVPAEPAGYEDEAEAFDPAIDGGPGGPTTTPAPEAEKGGRAR